MDGFDADFPWTAPVAFPLSSMLISDTGPGGPRIAGCSGASMLFGTIGCNLGYLQPFQFDDRKAN